MKFEVIKKPKAEILITVELSPEEWSKYEDQASRRASEKIDIPGFRKGQAPKAFVISQIGPEAFFHETLNIALPMSYMQAVKDNNIQAISRPDVKVLSRSPFKYEARVAVFPEMKIKSVDKIKIPQKPIEVTEKEIDEVVEEMRKYRATYKPLDREIKKGDRVEIDFQGFDEGGAALDKTKSTNHPLFIGEGTLVPGFEEELVGMKQGGKKRFPLKFPKDFHHKPLAGKNVHFEVEIKRAQEPILPEISEEFVTQIMGEKKTVPEFKQAIKQDMIRKKNIDSRRLRENELLEKLIKEAKFDVPPVLVEEEVDYMIEDFKREIESKGLSFDTYLEKLKKENRDLAKDYAPEAEKRVRVRLILNYLFKELGIEATEDEIKRAFEKFLQSMPEAEHQKLKENFEKKGEIYLRLKNNLMLEKLFAKFLD